MPSQTLAEQLSKYLADVHAIEAQALIQMRAAPRIASDPDLAAAFERHRVETKGHERLVRRRLEDRGGSPTPLKEVAAKVTGAGFALFAQLQPDTPVKLAAHAFSYEHLELVAYELLARVARRADDLETAQAAEQIREEEQQMAQRLESLFERAVDATLRKRPERPRSEQLIAYLTDAHAIEAQAAVLLARGRKIAGADEIAAAYGDHLRETREHTQLLEERLRARGAAPSRLKDAALSLGALNWGLFFQAQPDTPAKLAGFAYAFEHLEIAAYELLTLVARADGDEDTVGAAQTILGQERAAAERVFSLLDAALDASLRDLRLPVG